MKSDNERNIYDLMRMVFVELSGIVTVAIFMFQIVFSAVQVTARLTEYLLDVMMRARGGWKFALTFLRKFFAVAFLWWIYFKLLPWPILQEITDWTMFVVRVTGHA